MRVEYSFGEKVAMACVPSYRKCKVQELFQLVRQNLTGPESAELIRFIEPLTVGKAQNIQLAKMDHLRAKLLNTEYLLASNKVRQNKWSGYGLDVDVFKQETDFVFFAMEETALASQMKIWKAEFKKIEDGALIVNGKKMPLSEVVQKFKSIFSSRDQEYFIVDKETYKVHTYLGNGQGLQVYHPFKQANFNAIDEQPHTKLSQKEYDALLKKAQAFERVGETKDCDKENRNYIVEVVIPEEELSEDDWFYGVKKFFQGKHPCLRVTTPEGHVVEVGYGWQKQPFLPFSNITGRFRAPDFWAYLKPKQRNIVPIAISEKEFHALKTFQSYYFHRSEELGINSAFRLRDHNCSYFIRSALVYMTESTNNPSLGIESYISEKDLLLQMLPQFLQNAYAGYIAFSDDVDGFFKEYTVKPLYQLGHHGKNFLRTVLWVTCIGMPLFLVEKLLSSPFQEEAEDFDLKSPLSQKKKSSLLIGMDRLNPQKMQVSLPTMLLRWAKAQKNLEIV